MEQHQLISHRRSGSISSSDHTSYLRSKSYSSSHNTLSPYAHQMICLGNYSNRSSSWSHDPSPRNNTNPSSAIALVNPQRAKGMYSLSSFICSLLNAMALQSIILIPAAFRWLTESVVSSALSVMASPLCCTGTLFGHRKGHVYFTIQDHPRSQPLFVLDFPMSTSSLVKEMSSGLVKIAMECDKKGTYLSKSGKKSSNKKLLGEVEWTMYCNNNKCGTAKSIECNDFATFVLGTIGSTTVGAGVIPDGKAYDHGELMYMRASFERVIGNRDSEAFYMMNPDGNAGLPELSIFMLRF